ncbi:hypothetical protein [Nonomuraea basaltis]|uniref:hypothetical protein n=1 Tax=Nonomuraea basaltis TaxID=2495887 RepID=UPI00110C65FD|nr:hypothetical protein [Nonomuraea basaltis]TMR89478.1 hypothetical protein EJK15_60550 [Nonomuraea basaltis]
MNVRNTDGAPGRVEFAGAVYGSLLAASVVAGSAVDGTPISAGDLVVVLLCTGVVFWIAHVYALVVSRGTHTLTWQGLRVAGRQDWPVAQASFPPAIAAAFASALGMSDVIATWAALIVAVATQVTWALAAAVMARSSVQVVVVSGVVNLALGLAIVALKTLVAAH